MHIKVGCVCEITMTWQGFELQTINHFTEPWWLSWLERQFHFYLSTQGRVLEPGLLRSF